MILLRNIGKMIFHTVVWVNQPSTLQEYHRIHGDHVLACNDLDREYALVLLDDGIHRVRSSILVPVDDRCWSFYYHALREQFNLIR